MRTSFGFCPSTKPRRSKWEGNETWQKPIWRCFRHHVLFPMCKMDKGKSKSSGKSSGDNVLCIENTEMSPKCFLLLIKKSPENPCWDASERRNDYSKMKTILSSRGSLDWVYEFAPFLKSSAFCIIFRLLILLWPFCNQLYCTSRQKRATTTTLPLFQAIPITILE